MKCNCSASFGRVDQIHATKCPGLRQNLLDNGTERPVANAIHKPFHRKKPVYIYSKESAEALCQPMRTKASKIYFTTDIGFELLSSRGSKPVVHELVYCYGAPHFSFSFCLSHWLAQSCTPIIVRISHSTQHKKGQNRQKRILTNCIPSIHFFLFNV